MRGPHELLVEQTKQTVQSEVDLLEQAKKHKSKQSGKHVRKRSISSQANNLT